MEDRKYQRILFDLEATCWEDSEFQKENSEIIEIGAVRFDSRTFDEIDRFTCLCLPVKQPKLSDYCINLTGITQDELDSKGLPFSTAWNSFLGWAGSVPQFLAWGQYDYEEIVRSCQQHDLLPFSGRKYLNAKHLYTFYTGVRGGGLGGRLAAHGLTFEGQQHRALDDAVNTLRLLRSARFGL
jgi:inhibitor of KinA sporulation pathway (predicted exonuclease)